MRNKWLCMCDIQFQYKLHFLKNKCRKFHKKYTIFLNWPTHHLVNKGSHLPSGLAEDTVDEGQTFSLEITQHRVQEKTNFTLMRVGCVVIISCGSSSVSCPLCPLRIPSPLLWGANFNWKHSVKPVYTCSKYGKECGRLHSMKCQVQLSVWCTHLRRLCIMSLATTTAVLFWRLQEGRDTYGIDTVNTWFLDINTNWRKNVKIESSLCYDLSASS